MDIVSIIISILLIVVLVSVLSWAISLINFPAPLAILKQVLYILLALFAFVWILGAFGVAGFPSLHIGAFNR